MDNQYSHVDNPVLNNAISSFILANPSIDYSNNRLNTCVRKAIAEGSCMAASNLAVAHFKTYFKTIGQNAQVCVSNKDASFNPFFIGHILRETPTGYFIGQAMQIKPSLLGYRDRLIVGRYKRHVLIVVELNNIIYTIDFTASQYGYQSWPLVQCIKDNEIFRYTQKTGWDFICPLDIKKIKTLRAIEQDIFTASIKEIIDLGDPLPNYILKKVGA